MSRAIRSAIADEERLEREGKYAPALERLLDLQRFVALPELPSFDVHMLLSWLYMKTGDASKASMHKARADAIREVLLNRIGDGKTPETPIKAVMASDLAEWVRFQLGGISDVKSLPYEGRELLAVTYSGPSTNNKPAVSYFEIDPRVQARENSKQRLFSAISLEQMKPEHRAWFELARAKRDAFLNDTKISYLDLMGKVKTALTRAAQLDSQGNSDQALSSLRKIETTRPIEDIPLPRLIAMYSALNGKIGNAKKQNELRGLLFGINQAIAHSGDGLTPETAVHVIAIEEEYSWLSDNHLTRATQRVVEIPLGKFDLITAKNTAGEGRDYYFNITRMVEMYSQGL